MLFILKNFNSIQFDMLYIIKHCIQFNIIQQKLLNYLHFNKRLLYTRYNILRYFIIYILNKIQYTQYNTRTQKIQYNTILQNIISIFYIFIHNKIIVKYVSYYIIILLHVNIYIIQPSHKKYKVQYYQTLYQTNFLLKILAKIFLSKISYFRQFYHILTYYHQFINTYIHMLFKILQQFEFVLCFLEKQLLLRNCRVAGLAKVANNNFDFDW
eukprot:TRINITY_DN19061_c0_g1_i1.p2 TRINITY_DN19061_c0_g1~~TRINITY_DN19061_c0_g1_i1.p2  ORF type:complete len:212 (+),score=-21.82 TRINITY_DN19061_c0_g1_i1:208-843(+)